MAIPPSGRWMTPAAYLAPRRQHRLLRMPETRAGRITLYATRRIGAHGLHDAQAASLMLEAFGLSFRRPLVLLRAVMLELSRATARPITLAPCCCRRMTRDEARLLAVLGNAHRDDIRARRHLARLAGRDAPAVLFAAGAYGAALSDLGAYPDGDLGSWLGAASA